MALKSAKLLLKGVDLDLAFVLPIPGSIEMQDGIEFSPVPLQKNNKAKSLQVLDEVVSVSKLGETYTVNPPCVAVG